MGCFNTKPTNKDASPSSTNTESNEPEPVQATTDNSACGDAENENKQTDATDSNDAAEKENTEAAATGTSTIAEES